VKKLVFLILIILNILAVAAIITSYLSVSVSPVKWWVPSFFGLAYPVILVVNIGFFLFWVLVRPRFSWFSLLAILIGWGFIAKFIQLRGKSMESADIKVLSYNVQFFSGNGEDSMKETSDEILAFLKDQRSDIICLQEVRLRQNEIFNLGEAVAGLDFINHYQFARSSTTYGSVTMTRYPIVNMGEIRFDNSRNITIYTDVLIGKDTVRIFNVHLQSYNLDPERYSIISSGIDEEEDLKEVREIGSRFKKGIRLRAEQVETLREYIEKSPYHTIICGDLNDTPVSYSYRQIKRGMKDSFVTSGKGLGFTYTGKFPYFRIDYIFHSTGFESYNFDTHDFRHSDHLPVSCSLIKR